jgi:DNA-binding beta-propeller fold protein YncE
LISGLLPDQRFAQTLVVAHKRADSVGFYDAQTGQSLAVVPVGVKPHEMAMTQDRRFALVTNYGVDSYTDKEEGGNTISIIDLVERKLVGEIGLGRFRRPHGIERGRSGRFYVTTDSPPALLVVDGERRQVAASFDVRQLLPHMVAISNDEKKAYTANAGEGSVTVIDLVKTGPNRHIIVGGVPMGLALTPDGRRLFVATRGGNSIAVIDVQKDDPLDPIEIEGGPSRLHFTPSGKHLLVSLLQTGEVAVIDPKTLAVVARFAAGAGVEGLASESNGRFAYVSAQGANKIIKFSLTDWKTVLEIATGERPDPLLIIDSRR